MKIFKLFPVLLVIAIGVAYYFFFVEGRELVNNEEMNKENQVVSPVDQEKYQAELKSIINAYDAVKLRLDASAKGASTTEIVVKDDLITEINTLKERLKNLKAPSKEYGPVHMDMVLSFDKFLEYLQNDNQSSDQESTSLIDQAKQILSDLSASSTKE